jgi:hypothetical protein
MKQNEKYEDLDKQMSKEIMQEFHGKTVECLCPHCNGNTDDCEDCQGEGSIVYEF